MLGISVARWMPRLVVLGTWLAVLGTSLALQGADRAQPRAILAALVPRLALEGASRVASGLLLPRRCATRKVAMGRRLERPLRLVLRDARLTLSMSQAEFGAALEWSRRTSARWESGSSNPPDVSLVKLASLLAPVDLELAAEVAAAASETLESLGLVAPPAPPATPPPAELADLVVCAVADAADLLPRALRPLLLTAFARARALGLTVEQVEESLRARLEAKTDKRREPVRLRVRVEQEAEGADAEPAVERRPRSRAR